MPAHDLFHHYPVMPGEIDSLAVKRAPTWDIHKHMLDQLAKETERWVRRALRRGPGWDVWRSDPEAKQGDQFIIVHKFALVPPGGSPPGKGLLFTQPELTPGERVRLLAGRHDWREDRWQDECGEADCGHACCESYRKARP